MFQGFSADTIDFLWGLRFNNNREWFQANKQTYTQQLWEPMQALAAAVREQYVLEGTILKTARIYRDVRYSGGIPYKEHLWFVIRRPDGFWSDHASLFFQISPEGGQVGFGFFAPSAALLKLHRTVLLEHPEQFFKCLEPILTDDRFTDESEYYKRPKPGSTPALEPWFQLKRCFIEWKIPAGDTLFSPELPKLLAECFQKLQPLYEYFDKLERSMTDAV